mmetsp:Transcript_7398/g.12288  ORF Transcript_7398/g.12288 Transcript_7398/m.12288 type:complete len:413 (-) Transcript_7398:703-1941(-)
MSSSTGELVIVQQKQIDTLEFLESNSDGAVQFVAVEDQILQLREGLHVFGNLSSQLVDAEIQENQVGQSANGCRNPSSSVGSLQGQLLKFNERSVVRDWGFVEKVVVRQEQVLQPRHVCNGVWNLARELISRQVKMRQVSQPADSEWDLTTNFVVIGRKVPDVLVLRNHLGDASRELVFAYVDNLKLFLVEEVLREGTTEGIMRKVQLLHIGSFQESFINLLIELVVAQVKTFQVGQRRKGVDLSSQLIVIKGDLDQPLHLRHAAWDFSFKFVVTQRQILQLLGKIVRKFAGEFIAFHREKVKVCEEHQCVRKRAGEAVAVKRQMGQVSQVPDFHGDASGHIVSRHENLSDTLIFTRTRSTELVMMLHVSLESIIPVAFILVAEELRSKSPIAAVPFIIQDSKNITLNEGVA